MSVYDLENGTRVIELGFGSTRVSTLTHENEESSHFILFSPLELESRKNNLAKLKGNEVLIRIANPSGVASYMLALVMLLETWQISKDPEEAQNVKNILAELKKSLELIKESPDNVESN